MSIYTVCQKSVVSVTPDTSIRFVADLMRGKNLGCVVVAAEQKPVGIVTDRDLALRRDRICGEEADEAPVSTIMTREVCTIRKDTGIFDAIQEMKSSGVRRLPVADAGGRLVG
ncbi:MAG TPA: CBS domain-containing protein, partial [Methanolinea sp.]|nr:CBS domain-containing protein [Methanolinea sp.]